MHVWLGFLYKIDACLVIKIIIYVHKYIFWLHFTFLETSRKGHNFL